MCRLIDNNHNSIASASDKVEHEEETSQDDETMRDESTNSDDDGVKHHNDGEAIIIDDKPDQDSQIFTQHHHVRKVVKTVVGKHGKLSCVVKFVDQDEENAKSSVKKRVKTPARSKNAKSRLQPRKPVHSTSSWCTTDSSSDQGSVEESDSNNVFDFIASPARPKPVKKRTKKVDPKVLRARRVAAANKKWSKNSKFTKNGKQKKKRGGRHVSFVEDTDSDTIRKGAELSTCSLESMDTGSDSMWDDVETEDEGSQVNLDDPPSQSVSKSLQSPDTHQNIGKEVPGPDGDKTSLVQRSQRSVSPGKRSSKSTLPDTHQDNGENAPGPGGDNKITATKNVKRTSPGKRTQRSMSPEKKSQGSTSSPGQRSQGSISPSSGSKKTTSPGRRDSKGMSPGQQAMAKRNIRGETPLHIAAIKVS